MINGGLMINLIYIDDNVDTMLDAYLDQFGLALLEPGSNYNSITFEPSLSYTDLLKNKFVQDANIVIIDSRLFENDNARVKFSGEEIALLFRKYYPFIETILISQNELGESYHYVKKFYNRTSSDYISYYNNTLASEIRSAQDRITQSRLFAAKLENNNELDQCIKDKLINSINGILEYDTLNTADIDSIISAFKEFEERING